MRLSIRAMNLLLLLAALTLVVSQSKRATASEADPTPGISVTSVSGRQQTWHQVGLAGLSVRALAVDQKDPLRLYVGVQLSRCRPLRVVEPITFYASIDGGATWNGTALGEPGCSTAVSQVELTATGRMFAIASGSGLTWSDDGGTSWQPVHPNFGESSADELQVTGIGAHTLAVSRTLPPVVVVDTGIDAVAAQDSGFSFARSQDGGATWERVRCPVRDPSPPLAVSPNSPDIMVVGAGHDGGLWRSDDGGKAWQQIAQGVVPGVINLIEISPTDSNVLYALNGAPVRADWGLWRSGDGGKSWNHVQKSTRLQLVAVDERDSTGNALIIVSVEGLYFSVDGGVTLVDLGRPPGGRWTARTLAVHDSELLVGTDDGIWQTSLPSLGPPVTGS